MDNKYKLLIYYKKNNVKEICLMGHIIYLIVLSSNLKSLFLQTDNREIVFNYVYIFQFIVLDNNNS